MERALCSRMQMGMPCDGVPLFSRHHPLCLVKAAQVPGYTDTYLMHRTPQQHICLIVSWPEPRQSSGKLPSTERFASLCHIHARCVPGRRRTGWGSRGGGGGFGWGRVGYTGEETQGWRRHKSIDEEEEEAFREGGGEEEEEEEEGGDDSHKAAREKADAEV